MVLDLQKQKKTNLSVFLCSVSENLFTDSLSRNPQEIFPNRCPSADGSAILKSSSTARSSRQLRFSRNSQCASYGGWKPPESVYRINNYHTPNGFLQSNSNRRWKYRPTFPETEKHKSRRLLLPKVLVRPRKPKSHWF